ncbi:hypothetical protein [Marinomonas sp. THO17]|uniref:hypothetical protein n=1 Tax=Marinomonas sp. THO17 TaxID=3149048 RepID=UPI00336BD1C4
MSYSTSCSCGKITVVANFPSPIEEYQARECDCDFCISRGLAYLSDVNGTISFSPKETMNQLKQGSGQATFWECDNCHDVVAVTNEKNGVVRGAVSKRLFARRFQLKPSVTVSPKKLSASEKSVRWPNVWSKVV